MRYVVAVLNLYSSYSIVYSFFIHSFQQRISQVENENLVKTRQLEEQLTNEKNRYKMDIENLQKELRDMKQRRSQNKNGEKERKHVTDDVCKASQVLFRSRIGMLLYEDALGLEC